MPVEGMLQMSWHHYCMMLVKPLEGLKLKNLQQVFCEAGKLLHNHA